MQLFKKIVFIMLCMPIFVQAKIVEYDLTIEYAMVNYTGKKQKAMTINGQIPAPTIEATIGDTLRVTFHNKMNVDTSIHWHGILLPNDQDGVPYLTTPPIKAHSSFTYEYPIIHTGTYWYHSHTHFHEERGLYGALVFHEKQEKQVDKEQVVVLSDWIDTNPNTVLANLKRDGDYYMLKKGNVQSWLGVLMNGSKAIENRMNLSWNRMGAMDISDIGYDAFLLNGKKESFLSAKPGEKIRLRIINSASASYFHVEYAGGFMEVVALDGIDVEPFLVNRFLIAIAETYDVIITVPKDNRSFELRASSEDGMGYSSLFIGDNHDRVSSTKIPKPNLYLRTFKHSHHKRNNNVKKHTTNSHGAHSSVHIKKIEVDNNKDKNYKDDYKNIRSLLPTSFSYQKPIREITMRLTGNMERYVWDINNVSLSESDKILVKKGEVVQFRMINQTMMHHPMHLHGHFFRVLNGQGEYSPLKHTVNVPPMDEVTIEFLASEDKDWFFHCHNLYHMMTGLSRIISYGKSAKSDKNIVSHLTADNNLFLFIDSAFDSNMMFGFTKIWNRRNTFVIHYDYDYKKSFEIDALYHRNFSRYLDVYCGANFERKPCELHAIKTGVFGVEFILPLWLKLDFRADTKGHMYAEFSSDLQLTNRLKFEWKVNTDKEFRTTFFYELTKEILANITYDSDYGFGGGIRFRLS